MLEELARETGAGVWTIASMLFFLGAWIAVAVKVLRTRPEQLAERARMPLSDGGGNGSERPRDESPRA